MKLSNFISSLFAALVVLCTPATWAAQISLQVYNGQWMCAEDGGGREVVANRGGIGAWEQFTLNDLNGGNLENGDEVTIQAANGLYFCAEGGGGQIVVANRGGVGAWEIFRIYKMNGGGAIGSGDQIALQACNGQWVCAEGGGGQEVVANRDGIGGWEVFTFVTDGSGGGGPNPNASASINPSATTVSVGQTVYFTISGSCDAGLNEIGLELCDGGGNPVANYGNVGVGGTSASYTFSWTPNAPGTYLFNGYAWNFNRSHLARTSPVAITVNPGISTQPHASISLSTTTASVGQTIGFTVNGACEAGLNEIGLELCDSGGNPVTNLGNIGVSGSSAGHVFHWQASSPGTYLFRGYAWNYNRSELARTDPMAVTVSSPPPVADSITNSGTPTTNSSFEVYANNVRNSVQVYFPTWTDAGGQDDIVWYEGTYDGAQNRWKMPISRSNHGGQYGSYSIHVYGVGADGAWVFIGNTSVTLNPPPPPSLDSITHSGSPTTADSFEIYANNVRHVTSVVFPTWTDHNGQDELRWYEGAFDAGSNRWKITVHRSNHNNERGTYRTHVYGRSVNGGEHYLGEITVTLSEPPPNPPQQPIGGSYDLRYDYNRRGQLTAIKDANGTAYATFAYHRDGLRSSRSLANDTHTTYGYDEAGRMTEINHYRGYDGARIQKHNYGYDLRDRRTWTQRDDHRGDTYSYQDDSQLIGFKLNAHDPRNNPHAWDRAVSYAYDAVGNRTNVNDNGAVTNYNVNAANQYTSVSGSLGGTINHSDGRGNVTQWKDWSYTYDAQNRLTTASRAGTNASLAYDATGRVIKRTVNGQNEYVYYAGTQQVIRLGDGGSLKDTTIWGPGMDEVVSYYTPNHGHLYCHTDTQGNVVALTDSSRNTVERYRYDPYGATQVCDAGWGDRGSSSYGVRFLYTGQEHLGWLDGAYNYKARIYSPGLGRFLQVDPTGLTAGDINLYRYCYNNAVNMTDPDGEIAFLIPVAIWAGKMAVAYAVDKGIDYARDNWVPEQHRGTFDAARNVYETAKAVTGDARAIRNVVKHADEVGALGMRSSRSTLSNAKVDTHTGPIEPYNRRKHYGNTPTKADRQAVGAGDGQVADHQPPLVKRYYEGDPAKGEKPGYQMTAAERKASASDRTRMSPQDATESAAQGAAMSQYSREEKKKRGL